MKILLSPNSIEYFVSDYEIDALCSSKTLVTKIEFGNIYLRFALNTREMKEDFDIFSDSDGYVLKLSPAILQMMQNEKTKGFTIEKMLRQHDRKVKIKIAKITKEVIND